MTQGQHNGKPRVPTEQFACSKLVNQLHVSGSVSRQQLSSQAGPLHRHSPGSTADRPHTAGSCLVLRNSTRIFVRQWSHQAHLEYHVVSASDTRERNLPGQTVHLLSMFEHDAGSDWGPPRHRFTSQMKMLTAVYTCYLIRAAQHGSCHNAASCTSTYCKTRYITGVTGSLAQQD
jgi:hypothetical protein